MKQAIVLLVFGVLCTQTIGAQESAKDAMLKQKTEFNDKTMVQRFERKLIPTAEERRVKRQQNEEKKAALLYLIDTTTAVKEKFKPRLKHDVLHDPFSPRLRKFLAQYQPETPKATVQLVKN